MVATGDIAAVAESYFLAHQSHDLAGIRKVFADNAQVLRGQQIVANGVNEIAALFETVFSTVDEGPTHGPLFVNGEQVSCEISITVGGSRCAIADFITVRGGKIERLVAYMDPAELPETITDHSRGA